MPRRHHTRAALIATALTVPLVVVLALVFSIGDSGGGSDSPASNSSQPLAPLTVTAPPSNATTVAPCTKVLAELPVSLGDLPPRVVHPEPDSPFVVAWGDPAVILRCGVERPAELVPGSSALLIDVSGVQFLPVNKKDVNVFTAIDREPYIEVEVPSSYTQPPLGPIADAIAKALPAVCLPVEEPGQPTVPEDQLCTHRK